MLRSITILTFLCVSLSVAAQDALLRFQLNYSEDYRLSVQDINTDIKEAMAEGDGKDRVVDTFIGEMYDIFKTEYLPELGLGTTDFSTYPDKLSLDPYGFPQASAKRAAKFMNAERFYAVEIRMEAANGLLTSDSGGLTIKEVGIKGDKSKFKPRVEVRLMIYDRRGKKRQAAKAGAKADQKIVIKESAFLSIIPVGKSQKLEDSQEVILDTFRKAMEKVMDNIK